MLKNINQQRSSKRDISTANVKIDENIINNNLNDNKNKNSINSNFDDSDERSKKLINSNRNTDNENLPKKSNAAVVSVRELLEDAHVAEVTVR